MHAHIAGQRLPGLVIGRSRFVPLGVDANEIPPIALAQPDGPWAMAMLGDHFGATTEYRPGGHFVQRFSKSYEADKDGAHSRITVNVTVWSTARGENWVPKDLLPLPAK